MSPLDAKNLDRSETNEVAAPGHAEARQKLGLVVLHDVEHGGERIEGRVVRQELVGVEYKHLLDQLWVLPTVSTRGKTNR